MVNVMNELVSILMIGISLSMDTFSLSLTLGTLSHMTRLKFVPFIVGLFHFFMPLIGNILGIKLVNIFHLTGHFLLGLILIFLGIDIAIHYFKDEEVNINLNLVGLILFALSVSFDSFTVGIGINAITNKYLLASIIFSLCSACFTYIGIIIGKYSSKYTGKYANIVGILLLLILGIYHLFV